ncbi:ribonuclease T2 [Roseitranquillus sediminis]|uniref:ribonuclease T2 n=1 Tax=Roseitranquillus sediminis TaxID=2809051 RepID=UPI001D0C3479|nr:ribonuclease T2 [Roseitranquillus sediminis]MBM9593273.1 ribonuclease T2 [Roseitranquillus sediminis]
MRLTALLAFCALPAFAAGEQAGDFDYYVLAMSWQPTWCTLEGGDSPQCDREAGWTLHGLWPQYEQGWPSDCPTGARDPSRDETAAMADIMGSDGLAWYQWRKHGRCAGVDPADYFAAAREAWGNVVRPEVLRQLDEPVRLPASVVEEAFLRDNPDWTADMVTITCRDGLIQEARLCLSPDLKPRACAPDVRRDCALGDALMLPIGSR